MNRELVLRGARLKLQEGSEPEHLDLCIDTRGRISAIGSSLRAPENASVLDVSGRLIVPGLVDMHQHLDKSRTRHLVSNPSGTLAGASAGYREFASKVAVEDIIARAERTIDACSAYGTVAIRSHTNIEPQTKLRGIEAMLTVRERCSDIMTVQIVAHVTSEATSMFVQAEEWLNAAIAQGVDAIGGVPAYSDRPIEFLKLLFKAAERSALPLDMHIDEHLNDSGLLFQPLIELTKAYGMGGRVVAGHCSALAALSATEAHRIVEGFAEAGIGVVTLPAANLFLQGRDATQLTPRGLTRINELLTAGVHVAAGSDNIQDPFVPTGSGDLLEVARWTLLAGHLGLDDLCEAFDMVAATPAKLMGLADWGLHVGARADLLIVEAGNVEDLVASGTPERLVMFGGRFVHPKSEDSLYTRRRVPPDEHL